VIGGDGGVEIRLSHRANRIGAGSGGTDSFAVLDRTSHYWA
jgi:hypothetical protein